MKRAWSALLIGLALFLLSGALLGMQSGAQGQAEEDGWTFLGGPTAPGGTADAIAVAPLAPDTVYALVQGRAGERLFRSDDAALTWQHTYTFTTAADALAVDPTNPATLYAGAPDGLFRSTDGGLSWTQVYTVGAAFAVASPPLLYAGGEIAGPDNACHTSYFGVARSEDGGTTWRMTPIGCATDLTIIAVHPANPKILYAGGSGLNEKLPLLLRSSDGGTAWTSLSPTTSGLYTIYGLVLDPTQPERLFVSDYYGVLRSTDGGDTWERLDWRRQALPARPYRLAVDSNGRLYAVTVHGSGQIPIYRSDDGGETWWVSVAHLPQGANVLVADPIHPGILYVGLPGYGIFHSTNGGGGWRERNLGIRSLVAVGALAVVHGDPDLAYAGADKPRGGLFRSNDGGWTWTEVITDTPILAVAVNPVTPTIAYAGGSAGLYETQDGQRWQRPSVEMGVNDLAIASQTPEWAYAGGQKDYQGYIARRIPAQPGQYAWWRTVPVPDSLDILAVAVHPQNPTLVFAGGVALKKYGVVYRSRNGGLTWGEVLSGALFEGVNTLAVDEHHPNVLYAGTGGQGVYRSRDGGDTWEHWLAGLSGGKAAAIYALTVDVLGIPYAGTADGAYRWDTGQAAWAPFGLQGQPVLALTVADGPPQVLLVSTEAGIWQRTLNLQRAWLPLVRR